jgi:hypothetical protein
MNLEGSPVPRISRGSPDQPLTRRSSLRMGKTDLSKDSSLATLRHIAGTVSGRLLRSGNVEHAVDNHLRSLLEMAGCPICNERFESERVHLFWLLSESCQQPQILEQIAGGLGFCSAHAMYLISRGEYLDSLAYIYRWVIEDVLRELGRCSKKVDQPRFSAPQACYTCRTLDEEVRNSGFRRMLAANEMWRAYGRPGLLCARHLVTATEAETSFRVGLLLEVHRSHLVNVRAALETCHRPQSDSDPLLRALLLTVGREPHLVREPFGHSPPEWDLHGGDAVTRLRANFRSVPDCPICLEMRGARSEWYRWINARSAVNENLGDLLPCCSNHSWELVRAGSPMTAKVTALHLCQQLIDDVRKAMSILSASRSRPRWAGRFIKLPWRTGSTLEAPWTGLLSRSCPVCYRQAVAEERAISLLMTLLGERGVQSDYECGHGLCVQHLARILRRKESTQNAPFLISAEATKLSLLGWEIDERQRKTAYQWRPEAKNPVDTAWCRAIVKVSGSSDIAIAELNT